MTCKIDLTEKIPYLGHRQNNTGGNSANLSDVRQPQLTEGKGGCARQRLAMFHRGGTAVGNSG